MPRKVLDTFTTGGSINSVPTAEGIDRRQGFVDQSPEQLVRAKIAAARSAAILATVKHPSEIRNEIAERAHQAERLFLEIDHREVLRQAHAKRAPAAAEVDRLRKGHQRAQERLDELHEAGKVAGEERATRLAEASRRAVAELLGDEVDAASSPLSAPGPGNMTDGTKPLAEALAVAEQAERTLAT
jgi:hypothetical protein